MTIEFLALNAEFEMGFPVLRVPLELLQADLEIEPLLLRDAFAVANLTVVVNRDGKIREFETRRGIRVGSMIS